MDVASGMANSDVSMGLGSVVAHGKNGGGEKRTRQRWEVTGLTRP